jgi:hypothetical protein
MGTTIFCLVDIYEGLCAEEEDKSVSFWNYLIQLFQNEETIRLSLKRELFNDLEKSYQQVVAKGGLHLEEAMGMCAVQMITDLPARCVEELVLDSRLVESYFNIHAIVNRVFPIEGTDSLLLEDTLALFGGLDAVKGLSTGLSTCQQVKVTCQPAAGKKKLFFCVNLKWWSDCF